MYDLTLSVFYLNYTMSLVINELLFIGNISKHLVKY